MSKKMLPEGLEPSTLALLKRNFFLTDITVNYKHHALDQLSYGSCCTVYMG